MHKRTLQLIGALLMFSAISSNCIGDTFRTTYFLRVEEPVVVDADQVSFVVEAYTSPWRLPDSPLKNTNIRGYLLTAQLNNKDHVAASRRVFGPLYKIDGPVSSISRGANAPFTEQDKMALEQESKVSYDFHGHWIKRTPIGHEPRWHQRTLKLDVNSARWIDDGVKDALPLSGDASAAVESSSGQFLLFRSKGNSLLYNLATHEKVEDKWIDKIYADLNSNHDLREQSGYLTNDLKYLVIYPHSWFSPLSGEHVNDFTLNGHTYTCDDHIIVFERPDISPTVYPKEKEVLSQRGKPYSIDGRLAFLDYSPSKASFYDLDHQTLVSIDFPQRHEWLTTQGEGWSRVQAHHDAINNRVVFTGRFLLVADNDRTPDDSVHILIWYYKEKRVDSYTIHLLDLMEMKSDGYYPKDIIATGD